MPVSPESGASLAASILEMIHQVEAALLRLIGQSLRSGLALPDEQWAAQNLSQMLMLRRQITNGTQRLSGELHGEVQRIVLDAYNRGQALAVNDVIDLGRLHVPAPDPLTVSERLAAQAIQSLDRAVANLPDLLGNAYVEAVRGGADEVLSGRMTRVQAAQQVLDRLATRGVTGFHDAAGRNWSLESYAEMAVRTAAGHAAIQGHVDSLAASGMDLVIVQEGPRHCPLCAPWNRMVLSIGGRVGAAIEPSEMTGQPVVVTIAGSVEEARSAGWGHPNCRCTLSAYTVGVTRIGDRTPAGNAAGYEAGQRQREIERNIRMWKRREAASLDAAASAKARAKVRSWQQELRLHIEEHDLQRLRRREQIGKAL